MRPFSYDRPATAEQAVLAAASGAIAGGGSTQESAPATFLAGGTTLIDLMKLDVLRPTALVDLTAVPGMDGVQATDAGLRLGALARMAEVADQTEVRRTYPVIYGALWQAASAQLRNMATMGGNLLQRTRCAYFRDTSWPACNRRNPGSGCQALQAPNRMHAVLGTSDACIATYPGDLAVALVALDASVETLGLNGARQVPVAGLHRLPGDTPHLETTLQPGELITAITVPAGAHTRRSLYRKVRDRESYAFANASAAVALDLDGGTVRDARIALGGVATVPWRARAAEDALRGRSLDEAAATEAARIAFADAEGHGDNDFKIPLGQRTLARALLDAAAMTL